MTDLVKNGNFKDNQCKDQYCQYNIHNYLNQVAGWIPSPAM
jgi:hypothetical protein